MNFLGTPKDLMVKYKDTDEITIIKNEYTNTFCFGFITYFR